MCVPAGSAKDQVLAVFKHFNISVNTSDIFSRCQVRKFSPPPRLPSNPSPPHRNQTSLDYTQPRTQGLIYAHRHPPPQAVSGGWTTPRQTTPPNYHRQPPDCQRHHPTTTRLPTGHHPTTTDNHPTTNDTTQLPSTTIQHPTANDTTRLPATPPNYHPTTTQLRCITSRCLFCRNKILSLSMFRFVTETSTLR